MVKTWKTESRPDVTCGDCGSVYAVSMTRYPAKDQDSFNCEVCGKLLDEWNSTHCPDYELKERGEAPQKD